jgi:UPF0271 protein
MLSLVDINCDMGESTSDNRDAEFMPFISSCNVCCGAHAGTRDIIARTVAAAVAAGVAIGAHPSYPDRDHFGRRSMRIDDAALSDSIRDQISLLKQITSAAGGEIAYVKPHGALYNDMVADANRAATVLDAITDAVGTLAVYGLADSRVAEAAASREMRFIHEVFADRRYEPDLTLTPRAKRNAVIESETDLIAQLAGFVQNQTVIASDGAECPLTVESICIHSDTRGALTFARCVHEYLQEHNVRIASPL